jgi:FtsP/CotA-like multicopper oxidase with cupredoxin domain
MTWNMLAYNGTIPGPTLRVHQGDTITIHFKNNTDLKTLLHSHGIRMENAFDGNQLVQKEMEPGESFNYTLTFPDAGVYWYHPHVRDDLEQPLGLYANIIVDPKDQQEWNTVQS